MAKVFILEDDPQRIKIFKIKLSQHELFFTEEVEEGKEIFENLGPFDYIFLDHDLGGEIYVDSNEKNTGYQFAKYLHDKDLTNTQVIVHSMNYQGAKNICAILKTAQYHPWIDLVKTLNG
jgi:CheY-like chemotaxis protein